MCRACCTRGRVRPHPSSQGVLQHVVACGACVSLTASGGAAASGGPASRTSVLDRLNAIKKANAEKAAAARAAAGGGGVDAGSGEGGVANPLQGAAEAEEAPIDAEEPWDDESRAVL